MIWAQAKDRHLKTCLFLLPLWYLGVSFIVVGTCSVKGIEGPPLMVTLQRVQATSSFEASHCCWGCLFQAPSLVLFQVVHLFYSSNLFMQQVRSLGHKFYLLWQVLDVFFCNIYYATNQGKI